MFRDVKHVELGSPLTLTVQQIVSSNPSLPFLKHPTHPAMRSSENMHPLRNMSQPFLVTEDMRQACKFRRARGATHDIWCSVLKIESGTCPIVVKTHGAALNGQALTHFLAILLSLNNCMPTCILVCSRLSSDAWLTPCILDLPHLRPALISAECAW